MRVVFDHAQSMAVKRRSGKTTSLLPDIRGVMWKAPITKDQAISVAIDNKRRRLYILWPKNKTR